MMHVPLPKLLLLTDRAQLPVGRTLLDQVAAALNAGASHVVVRELDLDDEERDALAAAFSAHGATVIAARRPLPHAVGTHLPSSSAPSEVAYGRSCHSRGDVVAAAARNAAYATLGPFAGTDSKPGYGPPIDRDAYRGLPLPTYALGGISPANAGAAMSAGAYGIAVMGAVMRSEDPGATVQALLEAIS